VAEHPDSIPLAAPVKEAIDEAMEEIRAAVTKRGGPGSVEHDFRQMGHLGRVFQQCNKLLEARLRNADAGNDIVRRWAAELSDHNNHVSEHSPSEEPPPQAMLS
jgi:hypothetical protein